MIRALPRNEPELNGLCPEQHLVLTLDVISFNAVISVCKKGGQWQQALSLLEDMLTVGVTLDVISFSAAISACEKGE